MFLLLLLFYVFFPDKLIYMFVLYTTFGTSKHGCGICTSWRAIISFQILTIIFAFILVTSWQSSCLLPLSHLCFVLAYTFIFVLILLTWSNLVLLTLPILQRSKLRIRSLRTTGNYTDAKLNLNTISHETNSEPSEYIRMLQRRQVYKSSKKNSEEQKIIPYKQGSLLITR